MKTIRFITCLFILLFGSMNALNAQQSTDNQQPNPGTDAYQVAKETGQLEPFQISSFATDPSFEMPTASNSYFETSSLVGDDCYIPHDTATWSFLPANDDGSTALIEIPFTFNMYGTEYTSLYINNNGNITFNAPVSGYTPSGFPITTPMIAPFWGDVDTRAAGSDVVWYQVTPTALYVNYPNVGYFNAQDDKLNTFQVIITDGNDPVIGVGNNVAFYYQDMSWTTGSASGGVNGFGGSPATVGVNSGDNTNFFQIGRFQEDSDNFVDPYDLNGGVHWLDEQCFVFNVNSASDSNIPPLLLNISQNSVTLCEGESVDVDFTFTGPESDQEVTVSLNDVSGTGSSISSLVINSGVTTGVLTVTGATAGAYELQLVATDDGDPVESTTINIPLVVEVCGEYDCPELQANFGDPCDDGNPNTINDMVTTSCECIGEPFVPNQCENWAIYMNNNLGGVTDIFNVDLSTGDAVLTYITTVGYQGHIAFNGGEDGDNLIYVVNNMNASFVKVDPATGDISAPVFLDMDIASITTAAFAPNGKLLMGTMTEDVIYSVDLTTPVPAVSVFDAFAPINGGDIAFDSAGVLYLATRAGNGFYKVYPDDVLADELIGTIPSLVTGMALTDSEQMIMSHKANSDLLLRNLDGSDPMMSFPLMLEDMPYAHADGDMTSGCNTFIPDSVWCQNFSMFYVDHAVGGIGSVYGVSFTDTDANLSLLTTVDFPAHIGYNAMDTLLYLVNPDGSNITAYNPTTAVFKGDLALTGLPETVSIVAVVFDPADGLLYLGDMEEGKIYTVNPTVSGAATLVASDLPINGGDLAIQDGTLYLAGRTDNKLYEIVGGVAFEIGGIPVQVNGMAQANSPAPTDLIIANNYASVFTKVEAEDASVVATYAVMLDGSSFTCSNGDMAAGCADEDDENGPGFVEENNVLKVAGMSTISSFPNPSNGTSTVVFVTAEAGRTLVEVYDMNGKNVSTLYNQEAQAGLEYRVDFNGANLPNGVYVYKLTTNNETIINKFMIAR